MVAPSVATLYHYRAADGVWRDRCTKHVKTTGPYRAVTPLVTSRCRVCIECFPWGNGAHILYERPEDDHSQLERIDEANE